MKVFAVHQKSKARVEFHESSYQPQPWAVTLLVHPVALPLHCWHDWWRVLKALWTWRLPVSFELFTNYGGGFEYELLAHLNETPYPPGVYSVRDDQQVTGNSLRYLNAEQKCEAAWVAR